MNSERFFQMMPADDYALVVKRDGATYIDRVVAFCLTDSGVENPNPFKMGSVGRMVPVVARYNVIDGEVSTTLVEGEGVLVHTSSFGTDQNKVTAMKSGKPLRGA